jgi:hypothetical protein
MHFFNPEQCGQIIVKPIEIVKTPVPWQMLQSPEPLHLEQKNDPVTSLWPSSYSLVV